MRTIAIKDLEMSVSLDQKALSNIRGGFNNAGYETNNTPARGILFSTVVRRAITGIYTNSSGKMERKIEEVVLEVEEKAGNVVTEAVLF